MLCTLHVGGQSNTQSPKCFNRKTRSSRALTSSLFKNFLTLFPQRSRLYIFQTDDSSKSGRAVHRVEDTVDATCLDELRTITCKIPHGAPCGPCGSHESILPTTPRTGLQSARHENVETRPQNPNPTGNLKLSNSKL